MRRNLTNEEYFRALQERADRYRSQAPDFEKVWNWTVGVLVVGVLVIAVPIILTLI